MTSNRLDARGGEFAIFARVPPPAPIAHGVTLTRHTTLADLGFGDGLSFAGLSGQQDLYFPVPAPTAIQGMRLILPYRTGSALESRRSLTITIGGRTIVATALPLAHEGVIDLPVTADAISNGFLHVVIRYDGAISDERCIDPLVAGAYLEFAASGGLQVSIAQERLKSVGDVLATFPQAIDIFLPSKSSTTQAAAALTLATAVPSSRLILDAPPVEESIWSRARFFLDSSERSALAVRAGSPPSISIGGKNPPAAARFLLGRWRNLAGAPAIDALEQRKALSLTDRIGFTELGGLQPMQQIAERGSWRITIPSYRIPAGRRIEAIKLDVMIADDGSPTPAIVTATMNGFLLGSARAEQGQRTRLQVEVPKGLVRTSNELVVSVIRQVRAGECSFSPQGYDAQLLPSSELVLEHDNHVSDFYQFASAFPAHVTISLPNAQALAPVSKLLRSLLRPGGAISVIYGKAEAADVIVSASAPAAVTPPLRFDQGFVELTDRNGATLLPSQSLQRFTTVQLIAREGRPQLWIRPGEDFTSLGDAEAPVELGLGNVAFLDGSSLKMAYSTERDQLIDIRYPARTSVKDFLSRYRIWLIGAAWLATTFGFVFLLRRAYRTGPR